MKELKSHECVIVIWYILHKNGYKCILPLELPVHVKILVTNLGL